MKALIEIELDTPEAQPRDMEVGDPGCEAMEPSTALELVARALTTPGEAPRLLNGVEFIDLEIITVIED